MGRRLTRTVYITRDDGTVESYGPDSVHIPADVAVQITNPKVWADGGPHSSGKASSAKPTVDPGAQPAVDPPAGELVKPPASGAGSGATEWIAYARRLSLDVADDATRGDVIELVEEYEQAQQNS